MIIRTNTVAVQRECEVRCSRVMEGVDDDTVNVNGRSWGPCQSKLMNYTMVHLTVEQDSRRMRCIAGMSG